MSESIYTLLDTLKTETSVPHANVKMQKHTFPRAELPTADQFENEEALKEWANQKGILHAVLQKGVRSHIIDMRARFKSTKKDTDWTAVQGQKNVDSYSWAVQTRPESKKTDEQLAHEYLGKLSPEALARILAAAAAEK